MQVSERVQHPKQKGMSMASTPVGRIQSIALGVTVALVCALIAMAAVGAIGQSVSLSAGSGILSPAFLLMLIPFAIWSYGLRLIRWHSLVRRLVPGLPLTVSGYTQVVGFAFSATPGRIAELYKLKLLERLTRLPATQSLPAVIVERVTDMAAFCSLALVGAIFNWSGIDDGGRSTRWMIAGLGLLILAVAFHVSRRYVRRIQFSQRLSRTWHTHGTRLSRFFPGIGRLNAMLSQVGEGGTKVTGSYALSFAFACVMLGRLGDGVILWQVAQVVGYPVSYSTALFMIGSAGLVGGFTLSPGGMGAAEATLVALIMARGAPLGPAMVTAFSARAMIFWIWVVLGLIVFLISHSKPLVGWAGHRAQDGMVVKE
jgi:uncharacterized protein (TIRG00374 family)